MALIVYAMLASFFVGEALSVPCAFAVPSDQNTCISYDISPLSMNSGTWANDTLFSYLINSCGDITSLPAICTGQPAAVAYQISESSHLCIPIGLSNSSYYNAESVFGTTGIKLLNYGGYQSRAFSVSYVCDPSAGIGKPTFLQQSTTGGMLYLFEWRSAHACPLSTVQEPCPITYADNWFSLSLRPLPTWFDDAKFGIFLHWGLYSVPAFKTEWYVHQLNGGQWGSSKSEPVADFVDFHNKVYGCSGVEPDKYPCTGPPFTFADFQPMFRAEFYDPDQWAQLFKAAGAKYVVLTSKHHEGYCLWPSAQHWNWNSYNSGPNIDLVGTLTQSVRNAGLIMGVYHSLREWYHPLYLQDNDDNCSTTSFVDEILLPSLVDLSQRYQPDVFWADGAGDAPCTHDSVTYWKAPKFISYLYNNASNKNTVIVNSRWGSNSGGDYETGSDRYTPGKLLPYKWESCYTVQSSWGYDRTENIENYLTATELVHQLVETVACGGNLLLNVGPSADGRIMPAFQERLLQIGAWLNVNGDAIYKSHPWRVQNESTTLWYTTSTDYSIVYATTFAWPDSGTLVLAEPKDGGAGVTVALLGSTDQIGFQFQADGLHITLPKINPLNVPAALAWTFALHGVI